MTLVTTLVAMSDFLRYFSPGSLSDEPSVPDPTRYIDGMTAPALLTAEDLARLRAGGVAGTIITTGHMPGDSIGIDAFVRELRARGLEVTTFSGVDTPLEPD